jgi:meso-butanediol dehydrogenase/(S,S)-butanediol dehydrogenase/diacetyl reductase
MTERKVALITGAGTGVGAATALMLAHKGYDVLINYSRSAADAERSAEACETAGADALLMQGDVSQDTDCRALARAAVERWGRIDALVNNAGVAVFKPLVQTSFEEWRHVMATNLDGVFLLSQATVPVMRKHGGGAIVNIASISGLRASTLRVAYGTSKAALIHLTKQQAVELAGMGIRCNAIAPGPVETAMAKQVHTPAIRKDYHDTVPLARYGTEEEIANGIGFLCSPEASYVTGQVLAVDGGFDAAGVGLPTLRRDFGDV